MRVSNATFKHLFLLGTVDALLRLWPGEPDERELTMAFGRGALLSLLGIPLPVLLLLALFWR
jgi:hypothetical protein